MENFDDAEARTRSDPLMGTQLNQYKKNNSEPPAKKDSDTRDDERKNNQIRPIECEFGLLNRADGSVRYSQANTSVIAAVYGPLSVKVKSEFIDRATVEVNFKSLTGQSTNFDTEKAALIRQTLETMIIRSLHPRSKISITIQVMKDDGSLLAAAINAASLALIDAGIQCNGVISAVCLATNENGHYAIDPTREEEAMSKNYTTFAFHNKQDGMILADTRGRLVDGVFDKYIEMGKRACQSVEAFFRLSFSKKFQ